MDQASASPRLLALVTRRHRELHHLAHGPRVDPEPPRRRLLAQTLNANRMTNLQIVVHVLHPPPSADSRQKGYPLPDFYSGATGNPAASVRDYCSGAYTLPAAESTIIRTGFSGYVPCAWAPSDRASVAAIASRDAFISVRLLPLIG